MLAGISLVYNNLFSKVNENFSFTLIYTSDYIIQTSVIYYFFCPFTNKCIHVLIHFNRSLSNLNLQNQGSDTT